MANYLIHYVKLRMRKPIMKICYHKTSWFILCVYTFYAFPSVTRHKQLQGRMKHIVWTEDQHWFIFSLFISTHEILTTNKSTILKFNNSDLFVLSTTLIYKHEYVCNVDIELIPFEICLIDMTTYSDSQI